MVRRRAATSILLVFLMSHFRPCSCGLNVRSSNCRKQVLTQPDCSFGVSLQFFETALGGLLNVDLGSGCLGDAVHLSEPTRSHSSEPPERVGGVFGSRKHQGYTER